MAKELLTERETNDAVEKIRGKLVCSRCIYDESIPSITFDEEGICNYCRMVDELKAEYHTGTSEGERHLLEIVEQIKREGKGDKEMYTIFGATHLRQHSA